MITNHKIAQVLTELGGDLRASKWNLKFRSDSTAILKWMDGLGITTKRGNSRVLAVDLPEALDVIHANAYESDYEPTQKKRTFRERCQPYNALLLKHLRITKDWFKKTGGLEPWLYLATVGVGIERAISRYNHVERWLVSTQPDSVPDDVFTWLLSGGRIIKRKDGRVLLLVNERSDFYVVIGRGSKARHYELDHVRLAMLLEAL